ncbi:hypothetical protein ACWC5G_35715, partial [Streptomyces sp. NPDC001274]
APGLPLPVPVPQRLGKPSARYPRPWIVTTWLLQGGQGIFGIAVGVVWQDVDAALSQLHGERVDTGETLVRNNPTDELARRRNRAG